MLEESYYAYVITRKYQNLLGHSFIVISCTDPETFRQGGPNNLFLVSSTYFTEGRTDLSREGIGPEGSIASRGVGVIRTYISKEAFSHINFQGGGLALMSPSGPAHVYEAVLIT